MSYGRGYGGGGSRDFNRGSLKPKPVEAGKEYEVDITEISRQGDGIARVQGFVVFVKNGKVGNKVKVKVTEVADRAFYIKYYRTKMFQIGYNKLPVAKYNLTELC